MELNTMGIRLALIYAVSAWNSLLILVEYLRYRVKEIYEEELDAYIQRVNTIEERRLCKNKQE